MTVRTTLSTADIDALVNALHPAPRSVLGYHEFARRNDAPVCVVRVLEPDAVAVSVRWEGAAAVELKAIHPAGLFEGRVPHRRPRQRYDRCALFRQLPNRRVGLGRRSGQDPL